MLLRWRTPARSERGETGTGERDFAKNRHRRVRGLFIRSQDWARDSRSIGNDGDLDREESPGRTRAEERDDKRAIPVSGRERRKEKQNVKCGVGCGCAGNGLACLLGCARGRGKGAGLQLCCTTALCTRVRFLFFLNLCYRSNNIAKQI